MIEAINVEAIQGVVDLEHAIMEAYSDPEARNKWKALVESGSPQESQLAIGILCAVEEMESDE